MKTKRERHCYAKVEDGTTRYYAVYGEDEVEIEKDVFDLLDCSYSKDRYLERTEQKRSVSIEQLADQMRGIETHGSLPPTLWVASAEDEFFMALENAQTISIMWEEIDRLPESDAELLLTHLSDDGAVTQLAEKYNIPKSTLYCRRKAIAQKIKERIRRRLDNE